MTVNFDFCKVDPTYVAKGFTTLVSIDAKLKEPSSVLTPTIIIKTSNFTSLQSNHCNYAYIPNFNRYYFMGNPVIMTGGRVEIPLSVDVLYSNYTELMDCYGYVVRQGRGVTYLSNSAYLPDNSVPIRTDIMTDNIPFSKTPFTVTDESNANARNVRNFVLTVVGGGNNV